MERLEKMRAMRIFILGAAFLAGGLMHRTPAVQAIEGVTATMEDVARLKSDISEGKINVGKTRLKEIRHSYGDAPTITDTDKKLTYEYGDLKIEFDKKKYLRRWEYDTFRKEVYTDKAKDLRTKLEAKKITGDYITLEKIRRDFDEPTETEETVDDGDMSACYYGNIKLIFENVISVRSWKGKNLGKGAQEAKAAEMTTEDKDEKKKKQR